MKMFDMNITLLKNGQEKPYADIIDKYEIAISGDLTGINPEKLVLDFCTKVLTHCNKSEQDDREFYESYYTFENIFDDERKKVYYFTIISPYLD